MLYFSLFSVSFNRSKPINAADIRFLAVLTFLMFLILFRIKVASLFNHFRLKSNFFFENSRFIRLRLLEYTLQLLLAQPLFF